MKMASTEIDDFLAGPLVTWFASCLEDPNVLANYEDLVDGVLLHSVFLQINPEPLHDEVVPSNGNPVIRTKNLRTVVQNMKQFYEEELDNLILKLPDITNLGKEPELYIADMKLLLLLLLGCAVQCPNKEKFITNIKALHVNTQIAIVECIKQVTDHRDIVITQDAMENANMGYLFAQIKKWIQELDLYREKWRDAALDDSIERNDSSISAESEEISKVQQSHSVAKAEREDSHHYAVELADWKSKVRKQRQELEEKTEALLECKEELEHNKTLLVKLRQENQELMHEARTAKSYRDELDAVIERADRADRLEIEVSRYREKLTDIEFYKTRIEELREDNRVLMETREMLEEQLSSSRNRADKVLELESEIIKHKQLLNDMTLDRAADKEKYQELVEENTQLHQLTKAAASEAALAGSSDSEEPVHNDNRLSEQLTSNAQTRALKLELENRRLNTLIDSMKESSFHENSSRVLELEKEKKKLSLKIESLNDNKERLTQQNSDLELVCKQALEENKKLQNTLKNQRTFSEKQQQEIQTHHAKIIELEKNHDTAVKEKQRVQLLLESVQRRADDLERTLETTNQRVEDLKLIENNVNDINSKCLELEARLTATEKEKDIAQRDIHKYREAIEEKDVALDKATNTIEVFERKVSQLEQELQDCVTQISRLQEIERSSKELDSRAAIDRETLEILQTNLVAEKLSNQQLYTVLDKLGLSDNILLSQPLETILEKIAQIPEVINLIKKSFISENSEETTESAKENDDINKSLEIMMEPLKQELEHLQMKLSMSQAAMEHLLSENAKLQVHITTLQSQSNSLTAQHTALQLANSQLVAEKEELLKERSTQQHIYSALLHDQNTLQSLHEQLNNEYENLRRERDVLKSSLRDVKNENRTLRENCERLEAKNEALQSEQEALINNTKSLNNLRGEHSKLKDDFRNLYTASERLKAEYRNLQDDYKKNKLELNRLSLKQTEMQGELGVKDEQCSDLKLEVNSLNERCDMLLEMNSGLDNDRRSLMEHISLLFTQYHELLTHSLQDKEHYHMEEKLFADKVNHLHRQKEKLEDKIMEHYRKLNSCTTKKKGFGASLVRRVRKAGSELLNKNRRSWAEDSKQSDSKTYESDTGGNDSDASTDDYRLPGKHGPSRVFGSDALGHAGTRRTVYYNDDSPPSSASLPTERLLAEPFQEQGDDAHTTQMESNLKPEAQVESRPFLIYNKVSAVINESKNIGSTMKDAAQDEALAEPPADKEPKTGSPIWYEYGCV
ncbi:hypothetical protein DMN91_008789 [Ooceraea biroi]|uniref:HOOK N-terminal domain-containing protein n=1 Tax=Ooceraea biroi TaxID=2015173 RepID=A0A3L8DE34_OOCBI|nr:girdin isoform X1 [Ooceraea biroi]RLU18432.1 hypothetical protein DMN91_008789 [Ooceraea biroi]